MSLAAGDKCPLKWHPLSDRPEQTILQENGDGPERMLAAHGKDFMISDDFLLSPLLGTDSFLDGQARALIRELAMGERAQAEMRKEDQEIDPERRRRVELTKDEIWEQPEAIRTTLDRERSAIAEVASEITRRGVSRILMTGCGDSLACMLAVRALYESALSIPCEPVQALDLSYYYQGPVSKDTLVIGLSSSGQTARIVEGLLLARSHGAQTVALSNTPESPVMRAGELALVVHAKRRGWPTQSSTSAMAVLYQLGLELAKSRGVRGALVDQLEVGLRRTPDEIAATLKDNDAIVAALAQAEIEHRTVLYAGGGPSFACATFGAAKFAECTPDHGIAIPLEEFHHYHSQKRGESLFLIAPRGPSLARAIDTARAGRAQGGRVYALVTRGDKTLEGEVDTLLHLPMMDEALVPMVYTVPLQLFAYHCAMAKFQRAENPGKA